MDYLSFSSLRCAITLSTHLQRNGGLAVFQRIDNKCHVNNDRKAKASLCVPVSTRTGATATANNMTPGSGCVSLLQIQYIFDFGRFEIPNYKMAINMIYLKAGFVNWKIKYALGMSVQCGGNKRGI